LRAEIRGAVARAYGDPTVVEVAELQRPTLRPGSARIAVCAASVNFPDVLVLANRYQVKVAVPYTPGCEFSGTVLEVADDVTTPAPGDAVFGMASHGAFASEVVLETTRLTVLPPEADVRTAAAFGVTYFTAYHALRTMADVQPGQWVVVLGAAGGVGMAVVDCARALGARVVAVASSEEKRAACLAQGAEIVLDPSTPDLKERLKQTTGGGADVVVDPVGGVLSEQALRATRWGARFVVVGFASGEIPQMPLNLVLLKGVVVMGFENRTIVDHHPRAREHRREIVELFATGAVRPWIGARYDLDQVATALTDVAERRSVGKVLIDIGGGAR
jgi:NADPH:quinone reductase